LLLCDGRQAVGDDNGGAAGYQLIDGFLYQLLAFGIYGRRGFVQHQHGGVIQEGADKRKQLPLAQR